MEHFNFSTLAAARKSLRSDLQMEVLAYTFVNPRATYRDIVDDVTAATGEKETRIRSALNSLMRKGYIARSGQPFHPILCQEICEMALDTNASGSIKAPKQRVRNALYQNTLIVDDVEDLITHKSVQQYLSRGGLVTSETDFAPKTRVEAEKALWITRGFLASLIPSYEQTAPEVSDACFTLLKMLRTRIKEDLEKGRLGFL